MKKELVSCAIWVVVFAAILSMALALPESVAPYPTMIAAAGLTISLIQSALFGFRYYRDHKLAAAVQAETGVLPQMKTAKKIPPEEKKRIAVTAALLIAYGFCFTRLGYILSTVLFLFIFMHLLSYDQKGPKTLAKEAVVAVGVTLVIYLVFEVLLHVNFPKGFFF